MSDEPTLDVSAARAAFPALADGYLFADNAGGSQCLASVASAISDYLLRTNVQLGADYAVSVESTRRVAEGAEASRVLFNAASVAEVGFGSSSTQVAENLAKALEADFNEGDEIIITTEHEGKA
jgi:selenocysteine lyase/cysteine desulfurase